MRLETAEGFGGNVTNNKTLLGFAIFSLYLLSLSSCSSDSQTTNKTQTSVQKAQSTFMNIDASSTFVFRPTVLKATSDSCGAPTNFRIELTEQSGSKQTSVIIQAAGSSVAVGKVYSESEPHADPFVFTNLILSEGGVLSHGMGAEPNDVVASAARFDALTPTTFTVAFALRTHEGKLLNGSAAGAITVDTSCPYGKSERREGYDLFGAKHVCYVQPEAPVPDIGCIPSNQERRFLELCRARGKTVVSCGPCEEYCSERL